MKKNHFIVLLFVVCMLYSCKIMHNKQVYVRLFREKWCDSSEIEKDYGTIYGKDYDNERKIDSTYYVSDSLSGVFLGIKGMDKKTDLSTYTHFPNFENPFVEVRLQLNDDGTSLFSESFGLYRGKGYGKWCVKDSMMYLMCDGKRHLENKQDTTSNVLAMFRFRYKEIDVKILDKNRLQLKNGTILFRQ